MGALGTTLLVLGILMLIEGLTIIFFPKCSLKISRRFFRFIEKNLKSWGIVELIIAIILIVIGLIL